MGQVSDWLSVLRRSVIQVSFAVLLMVPTGVSAGISPAYYDSVTTSGIVSRAALSNRLATGHNRIGYDNTWEPLRDIDRSTTSAIHTRLIYGGDIRENTSGTDGDGSADTGGWNREHLFPQSFFNSDEPMRSDIHALYPADSDVNFRRSNSPYDVVAAPTLVDEFGNRSTTDYFEPAAVDKGRVARAILYMDVRYEGLSGEPDLTVINNYPGGTGAGQMAYLNTLLTWHRQFPPDAQERARNARAYTYQNNPNPFVDHPEWVDDIFGGTSWATEDGNQLMVSANGPGAAIVAAGTVDFPVLSLNADTTGQEVHLNSLLLNNLGTATSQDVMSIKVWFDADNSAHVSSHDSLLGTATFQTTSTVVSFSHPFYAARGRTNLLITATVPFQASAGRTLQFAVPNSGIGLSSTGGNDAVAPFAEVASAIHTITGSTSAASGLVISEVFEGTLGNLKYIELANTTSQTIDLATAGVVLRRYTNGGGTPQAITLNSGSIAPGDLYVLANNNSEFQTAFGFLADGVNSNISHNGNDLYELVQVASGLAVDGFAMDRLGNSADFAVDRVAHRVMPALPNTGAWGAGMGSPVDNALSPSGLWRVRVVTAGNSNAATVGTPGTLDEQNTAVSDWQMY